MIIYNIYIYSFFLEGWSWEIGRHNTAVLVCFAEISPEKGTQKTCQQCCFHFSNIHMLLGFGPRKQVLKKPLKICPMLSICFL